MKQKLFNVAIYGMLAYSLLNAGYIALPIEYQEMIPQYNQLVALVSGGATFLIGSGGLAVQSFINKAKHEADSKFNLLANNYLNLEKKYDSIDERYKNIVRASDKVAAEISRSNQLLKAHLEAKLSNPMIDEAVKLLIEGVIKDE